MSNILKDTKRLYPSGRAFRIPFNGVLEKMHRGLAVSEEKLRSDSLAVLDSILPDNANFTEEDAADWERRLGLIGGSAVSLEDRKMAILTKMNHPGTIKARQHYLYLERQLRNSGFNVRVYENRFAEPDFVPEQLGLSEMGISEMGGEEPNDVKYSVIDPESLVASQDAQFGLSEFGDAEMGGLIPSGKSYEVIANYIEPELDANFFDPLQTGYQLGASAEMGVAEMGVAFDYLTALKCTFFVMGDTFGSFIQIPGDRHDEFRQLILKTKPVQAVGFLFTELTDEDYNDDYNDDYNSQEI